MDKPDPPDDPPPDKPRTWADMPFPFRPDGSFRFERPPLFVDDEERREVYRRLLAERKAAREAKAKEDEDNNAESGSD
jgi:hypothetical protein